MKGMEMQSSLSTGVNRLRAYKELEGDKRCANTIIFVDRVLSDQRAIGA